MMMEKRCFMIRPIDEHREYVSSISNSDMDKAVHKRAGEIYKNILDSEGTLKDVGWNLCRVYEMSQALKQKGGTVNDLVYPFVVEILENLWQEGAADYSKCHDVFLANFSKEIDSKRPDSVEAVVEPLYGGDGPREDETAEILLQNLDEVGRFVEERNQLIGEYGELFAFLIRKLGTCLGTQGKYDQLRQLNDDLPLIKFVQNCASDRALELAVEALKPQLETSQAPSTGSPDFPTTLEPMSSESVPETFQATDPAPEPLETSSAPVSPCESQVRPEIPEGTETPSLNQELPQQESAQGESAQPETTQAPSAPFAPEGGNRADVLFVLDASGSMRPCFDQLKTHIKRFVAPFKEAGFSSLRLGLLAYSANKNYTTKKYVYRNRFLSPHKASNMSVLYGDPKTASTMFFTSPTDIEAGVNQFVRRLDEIICKGDEDTPFALDCAADFPFEPLNTTRRVVILFTDERMDEGVTKMGSLGDRFETLEKIMDKISQRHISLYYYGPHSAATDVIQDYPRVFFKDVIADQDRQSPTETWDSLDVEHVMESLGKSISSSALSGVEEPATMRAIYGQDSWEEESWS